LGGVECFAAFAEEFSQYEVELLAEQFVLALQGSDLVEQLLFALRSHSARELRHI